MVSLVYMQDPCRETTRKVMPVVNLNKCEGKGPCIEICPYDVFEMKAISEEAFSRLSLIGKIKTMAHGREKASVINPGECHNCGLCVTACPEKAITLAKFADYRL